MEDLEGCDLVGELMGLAEAVKKMPAMCDEKERGLAILLEMVGARIAHIAQKMDDQNFEPGCG